LAQIGDTDAAKRMWRSVEVAFGPIPSEKRWVELSQLGLSAVVKPENNTFRGPPDHSALDAALKHAKSLMAAGKTAEATAIYRSLQELFRDDPVTTEAIRRAIESK
jgi:hypothetical protein